VIFERSNVPVDPGILERVMQRLEHRGPDGSDVCQAGNVAMGHWHFWVNPEEVGERQPLELAGLPFRIVMDGRLDNRSELVKSLNINLVESSRLSDAALVLHAYDCWGEHCFEHFIGEYALVIIDERRGELLCVRDALGDRTLFYTLDASRVLIASEPWAVAGATGKNPDLDEVGMAYYFAMETPDDGRTLFKDINELLPAQVLAVSHTGERRWSYWQADLSVRIRYRSDEEYAEQFRSLLEESIRCRLRSAAPVGVLMSGGLDSTSVACLAARIIAPQPLTTISYVFDELADCDERPYIEMVKKQWGVRSIQIPCDDAWPFKDLQNWPLNQNHPAGNPFRLLKERVYHRTQQEGLRVLLTGGYADHMYRMGVGWLADLLGEGQLLEAWRELSSSIHYAGLRRILEEGFLQQVGRRLLNNLPGGTHLHRRPTMPDWLAPLSSGYLQKDKDKNGPVSTFGRNVSMLALEIAQGNSRESFYASRYELEICHPYRDRRLIEFVLAIPAYQLYYRGLYKRILRTAMRGILPEPIRTRSQPTSLASLFFRGVEREKIVLQACIQDPDAAWRKFIRPDWLVKLALDRNGHEGLVPWLCLSYETWYKSVL
jgi:asparagine synthase (glutamine-hydrolysing)